MTEWTPEEQAAHRKAWIEALRSGEYTQATGQLKTTTPAGEDAFCCLGVACNLAAEDGVGKWGDAPYTGTTFQSGDGDANMTILPEAMIEWLGLEGHDALIAERPADMDWITQDSLVTLNDTLSWGFNQIADFIEIEWPV